MNDFQHIKDQWQKHKTPSQPKNIEAIIAKSKTIARKQQISKVVLGITVLILIAFFMYVSAYKNTRAFWGLGLMIGCLCIRIMMEYLSGFKKAGFPLHQSMNSFNKQLVSYYKSRKIIHYLWTPLLFATYIFGFVLLLPIFKQQLSGGFYTYILISSILTFIALATLIGFQVKKELKIIKSLQ